MIEFILVQEEGTESQYVQEEEDLDSDLDEEDQEPETENLVLCQFEKVR